LTGAQCSLDTDAPVDAAGPVDSGGRDDAAVAPDAAMPPAPPITAPEAILLMQRGINIGNSFDAPPGETAWGNPEVQDYYFDDYMIAGFTGVRIPVTWDQHTDTNAPYAIDEAFISRVEQVVDWGLSRGLFILMNAHHESWIKHDYSATHISRFDAIWTQISKRFKDKSDRLVFEILNEPEAMSVDDLNALNDRILGIIRQTNPTRLVVYAGTNYSSDWDLQQVNVPGTDDKYLIANFHCYSPWSFVSGGPDVTWGTQADQDAITAIFDGVAAFVASKGIPVMVNEFGAGPNHDYDSRMAFYKSYVHNTINHGMAFFAWDDGGDFRTYDRQLPQDHTPGGKWVGDVKDVMTKP
jgi:aryl-phospho-beta-D-glucosidase BglC (GH1 family)